LPPKQPTKNEKKKGRLQESYGVVIALMKSNKWIVPFHALSRQRVLESLKIKSRELYTFHLAAILTPLSPSI
jgi:hypothetical protein